VINAGETIGGSNGGHPVFDLVGSDFNGQSAVPADQVMVVGG
jgi:hypothetical protein